VKRRNYKVGFEVLAAASMKMAVFWFVAMIALVMEAASTSETSVNFYQTILRNNPEESHLNYKVPSYVIFSILM
jgi:hypothetical protein